MKLKSNMWSSGSDISTLLQHFAYSMKDVNSYSELTDAEKEIISEEQFTKWFEEGEQQTEPQTQVPKDWEDFCKICPNCSDEWLISEDFESDFGTIPNGYFKRSSETKQLISSKQRAKAMLAFIQLIRIRDYVNAGWKPDWTENSKKYIILSFCDSMETGDAANYSYPLYFKTPEIRDRFLINFRDLIEEAKEFI